MILNKMELAWAAGLFEGEGSIYTTGNKGITIALASSDLDVVTRFANILNFPIKLRLTKGKVSNITGLPYKDMYEWRTSRFEFCQAAIALLWIWLGVRRKQDAIACLSLAKTGHKSPNTGWDLTKTACPQGHSFDMANTYIDKKGCRICRKCRTKASLACYYTNKKKAKVNVIPNS